MAKARIREMKDMNELAKSLTPENVRTLQEMLGIPSAIIEKTGTKPIDFLNSLKFKFTAFESHKFIDALQAIERPDLIPLASNISWDKTSDANRSANTEDPQSAKSLVNLLRSEVESTQWKIIVSTGLCKDVSTEIEFDTAFQLCIEGGLITKDMEELCEMMVAVDRQDLATKIKTYSPEFRKMSETEFQSKMMEELQSNETEDQVDWVKRLKEYTVQQHENVYIHFDDEDSTALESIYTPLTIVEEEIMRVKESQETSLNEIAFLRSMNQKGKTLKVVDFMSIISQHDPAKPKVLCLIGNPGCGKTYLCKYLALQYGMCKLNNFTYVLSVPCRNEEWHKMEKARQESEIEIEEEFLYKWFCLAMPMSIKWSKSIAKHLTKTGGEDLLLIIDGVDEFIKDVPFKTTLLYSLLQKRVLNRATLLLTSRPGAWNDIREEHGQALTVDSSFQVLGFYPSDRDSYFEKRISTVDKLRDTKELFFRHDEINQLSLVPVNASLFTSLFNATNNILSQTLTQLYSALIVYIIRRQLSRMGLKSLKRVERMAQFHPSILDCIDCIGKEAYEGIYHRELSCREEDVSIRVDSREYKTERLGHMQVQVKVLKLGRKVNVWTFAHLTLQEYIAAVYLSNKTWIMECIMVRYIVSSEEVFAMYRMVVRFLCGLRSDRAACFMPIICANIIPDTMPLNGIPMMHQLRYFSNIIEVSDWSQFTQVYLLICTLIVETNCQLMELFFQCFTNLLPEHVHFIFYESIAPNEYQCFLHSLKYFRQIEILYIKTSLINPNQFRLLLHQLSSCSLHYLAIAFYRKDTHQIQSYTSLLFSADIPIDYKISISLRECDLTESLHSNPLFPTTSNTLTGSIELFQSAISNEMLTHLTNQFAHIENLFYQPKSDYSDWFILLSLISNNTTIKGLCLSDPNSCLPATTDILPGLSSLEELYWYRKDPYAALPLLQTNNSLSSLTLLAPNEPPLRENYQDLLINLIYNNNTSLREIRLNFLPSVGLNSCTSILSPIQSCCNLVSQALVNTPFSSYDISCWDTAIRYLQSLVDLTLVAIPLQDTGLMELCKSLYKHPSIRSLCIVLCKPTSDSCEPIMMLIHTLPYLRLLRLYKPELSLPDASPLQLLQQTAELFSVKVELS